MTTKFEYHLDGDLSAIVNARGQRLTLDDYWGGTPQQIGFNGAFTVTRTTTWEGWVKSETDGRGAGYTTNYDYDAIGRPKTVAPPGTYATTYSYDDAKGSWTRMARGTYFKNTYVDGLGRAISTDDYFGVNTSTHYDGMGRVAFQSYPYTSVDEVGDKLEYDGLGRPLTQTKAFRPGPRGACDTPGACQVTYTYQANCSTREVQRADNDKVTTERCDLWFGSPDERIAQAGTGTGYIFGYTYSAAGKLLTVTAPLDQGRRRYEYDAKQFLRGQFSPESGTTTFVPNEIGQVSGQVDARGIQAVYDRDTDRLGRLGGVTYVGHPEENWTQTLDEVSNPKHLESTRGGSFDYIFDALNRMRSQTWSAPDVGAGVKVYTTLIHYDDAGCLDQLTYPSGAVVTMTCDPANRVKSVTYAIGGVSTQVVTNVEYHQSGQVATVAYGNNRTLTVDFDGRARVKKIDVPQVVGLYYGYDGADNVKTLCRDAGNGVCANGTAQRTMTYDGDDRLWAANAPWGSEQFGYDELGNRKTSSLTSTPATYAYDPDTNRLATVSGGDPISYMRLTWNAAGQLATSRVGAAAVTSYRYDGRGRRVSKEESGQATVYHYDAAGRVLAESLADGTRLRDFIYLGNQLVAVAGCIEGTNSSTCQGAQWYHTDTLGSVAARTDENGTLVAELEGKHWGESWFATGLQGDRQYNGRVYDAGTGFHDYGARLYWPEIGRFISPDTYHGDIANPQSLNRYAYVLNNPYKYVDPTGRDPVESRILANPVSYSYLERSGLADSVSVGYLSEHGLLRDAVASNGGQFQGLQQSEQDLLNVEQAFAVGVFPSLAGAAVSTLGAGTATRQSAAGDPAGSKLSAEAQRGIRSLEQRIAEHEQKLAKFKANPTVRPGMEKLPAELIRALLNV